LVERCLEGGGALVFCKLPRRRGKSQAEGGGRGGARLFALREGRDLRPYHRSRKKKRKGRGRCQRGGKAIKKPPLRKAFRADRGKAVGTKGELGKS